MSLPDYQGLMLPLPEALADGHERQLREVRDAIATGSRRASARAHVGAAHVALAAGLRAPAEPDGLLPSSA